MNFKILCRSFEAPTQPYQIKQTELMNFKILCRSFEAPTKPYQIKQTESKSAKK